MPVTINEG